MKKTISIVFVLLVVLCIKTTQAQAETNFVEQFLRRYRPALVNLPSTPEGSVQELAARIE